MTGMSGIEKELSLLFGISLEHFFSLTHCMTIELESPIKTKF